jgi:hypothetical protein
VAYSHNESRFFANPTHRMTNPLEISPTRDPAGVFAAAHSLWDAIFEAADRPGKAGLSESYNGLDELMREVLRVGTLFETWSCSHILFEELDEVWPYFIADNFGAAWLAISDAYSLASFNEDDCLRVAWELCLPIKRSHKVVLPLDVRAKHPNPLSPFTELRIQTTRTSANDGATEAFTASDDLFDEEFTSTRYSLYGQLSSGECEHIADRKFYEQLTALAQKLIPGIHFPHNPVSRRNSE